MQTAVATKGFLLASRMFGKDYAWHFDSARARRFSASRLENSATDKRLDPAYGQIFAHDILP